MAVGRSHAKRSKAGFSLIEAAMVMVILAVAIVPLIMAFTPGMAASRNAARTLALSNQARGTLNRILGMNYSVLKAEQGTNVNLATLFGSAVEAARENCVIDGVTNTPVVSIVDAGEATGALLQITVTSDHIRLSTLKAKL